MKKNKLLSYFKSILKKESLLNDVHKKYIDEVTIKEAETIISILKQEEEEARARVKRNLKGLFKDFPFLL